MKIRLYNARILTMEKGRPVFWGEVQTAGGRIFHVAETGTEDGSRKNGKPSCGKTFCPEEDGTGDGFRAERNSRGTEWDREIDCKGDLLMPGFKNAHTHSAMTFLRSYADDVPLQQWLNEKVFPREALLSGEDIYHLAKLAVLEYLTSGITAIFDMYLKPEEVARACTDTGMRCVLTSGLNNFTSSVEQQEEEYLKWNGEHSLVSYRLGFHSEYTCSKELLQGVAALARKYRAPVYTHLAETKAEVEGCRERYGMTPAVFLDSLGMFEYGGGGYHCVHMTERDMEVFVRNGMYVVTNPASNLKLASGIAPVAEFVRRGIPVAVGTDGPASNNCLDMFREMFLVCGLSKIREEDAASLDAFEVLRMATAAGAGAMGLGEADILAEGRMADLIRIDLRQPNMQPINNIPKNLVYSGSKANVLMTKVNGRILYENGKFSVGEEAEDIYGSCERIVNRILYA